MANEKDYSKEIYYKYYDPKGKILQIILNDNSILEGIFVGFSHGDTDAREPFVITWHFVPENEIEKYRNEVLADESREEFGRMIKQKEIKSVTFK